MTAYSTERPREVREGDAGLVWKPIIPVAAFAAFVEAVGLVVLPSFTPSIQSVFVWFLMLFPVFVVGLLLAAIFVRPKERVVGTPSHADATQLSSGSESAELPEGRFEPIEVPAPDVVPVRRR
jgi:Na+/H+-dicarboxylate symporter